MVLSHRIIVGKNLQKTIYWIQTNVTPSQTFSSPNNNACFAKI